MKTLKDAFEYRNVDSPRSTRSLIERFDHSPHDSLSALLRKAGPFKPDRDAYLFSNGSWAITEEDARVLRERYLQLVDPMAAIGSGMLRTALTGLAFSLVVDTVGLPIAAVNFVIDQVAPDLRNQLVDKIVSSFPGSYGRCGGMAFSGLDFFLVGWPVAGFGSKPGSGELRQYIWKRLLDSLELNAATFFEWIMLLHVLPVISRAASAALGAAAGSVIGGPLGAAVGAFVAGEDDVLGMGGVDALADKNREHWSRLREHLEHEAAWPIGFIKGGNANPVDQHQVLAIGYEDHLDDTGSLTIWDNNRGATSQILNLDLREGHSFVECQDNPKLNDVKGIICEEYSPQIPPASLRN